MRKWIFKVFLLLSFSGVFVPLFGQVTNTSFERAQANVERIKVLVDQGALPKSTLEEAEAKLGDAQDQATLSDTLYSPSHTQNMTPAEEAAMVTAATHLVDRAQARLEARQKLLEMGIISISEMIGVRNDLTSRRLVLDLAQNRVRLIEQLRQIVADEQRLEMHTMENSMIRYEGKADFRMDELPAIERDFKAQFHHELPVSAMGQTGLHQSMGLDHRNKVDVALNPEQPEGLWMRNYLEKLHIPYMAFKAAVAGAATAPHIHIGTGSSRLKIASR